MLTIIIPSYNHAAYIEACLKAALDVIGARVVVIDDGSTDKTVDVVESFIRRHEHYDVSLITKPNAGLVSSLNLGLSITDTEFFYLIASDDIPDAQGILDCLNLMLLNKNLKFCIGGAIAFYEGNDCDEKVVYDEAHNHFLRLAPEKRAHAAIFNYPAPLLLQSTLFRTSALREVKGWDPEIKLDDYPMFVKLLSQFPIFNTDFCYRPEVNVVKYRQHRDNSFRNSPKLFSMVSQAIRHLSSPPKSEYGVAKALAYYSLVSIKNRQFKYLASMLKASSLKVTVLSLYYVVQIILERLLSRLRFR